MSYEGYEQYLCAKGHYWCADCHDDPGDCETCGGPAVWSNSVDVTNGSYETIDGKEKRIDGHVELEVAAEAITNTCHCCGHVKMLEEERYKIPEDKGTRVGHALPTSAD
jgi:hypothetical protein